MTLRVAFLFVCGMSCYAARLRTPNRELGQKGARALRVREC